MQVNLYDAKTRLSELVDQAHAGDTIVIAKAGKPMARLVPLHDSARPTVRFGLLKGRFVEAADFDEPLADEMLDLWEGKSEL